jgi:tryptophan-rich sensory protein
MSSDAQAIILKRVALFACIWTPIFYFTQRLLIAETHLTVSECTVIAILTTGLPVSIVVYYWLAPWLGWNIPV